MKVFVALFLVFGCVSGWAVTVATPAAGYFRLAAPAGSDTQLVLPLLTRSEGLGRVVNVTTDSVQLDVPGIADGKFGPTAAGSYYLHIKTGSLGGLMFRIVSSTGTQLRLDTRGTDLKAHPLGSIEVGAHGALACVRKLATIKDVFGDGESAALAPVTSLVSGAYQEGDAIFVPSDSGRMEAGHARISYLVGSGWRRSGDVIGDAGMTVLRPGSGFVVRTGPTSEFESFLTGYAAYGRFAIDLPVTETGEVTDIHVGLIIAEEVSLQASGLLTSNVASSPVGASAAATLLKDLLLSWPGGRAGMDRPPDRRYYGIAETWYEAGRVADADALKPGSGYVLRLLGGRDKRFWFQNSTD